MTPGKKPLAEFEEYVDRVLEEKIPEEDTAEQKEILPADVIEKILINLPVKSLCRFKSVCPSWLSMISSPRFIQAHYELAKQNFNNYKVIFWFSNSEYHLRICALEPLLNGQPQPVFDNPAQNPLFTIVGSCNGLICLDAEPGQLIFWNPATNQSRWPRPSVPLIDPDTYLMNSNGYAGSHHGFGFVESMNDYVILQFLVDGWDNPRAMYYRLNAASWKPLKNFCCDPRTISSVDFASDKFHWLIYNYGSADIMYLDFETEEYKTLDQPDYGKPKIDEISMGELKGCLCVIHFHENNNDFWVLKEHGIKETWTKMFCINHNDPGTRFFKPLWILPDGEILLVASSGLFVYNPRDDAVRIVEATDIPPILDAFVYVESMISVLA